MRTAQPHRLQPLLRLLATVFAVVGSTGVLAASRAPDLAVATVVVDGMMKSQSGAT